MRLIDRSNLAIAVVASVLAGVVVATGFGSPHADPGGLFGIFYAIVGVAWVLGGLIARVRRPGNSAGALMIAVGIAWLLRGFELSGDPWLFAFGAIVVSLLFFGPFVQLLMTFPDGHARGSVERVAIALAWAASLITPLGVLFIQPQADFACAECPDNPAAIVDLGSLGSALAHLPELLGAAAATLAIVALVRAYRAAAPPRRRALMPVLVGGIGCFACFVLVVLIDAVYEPAAIVAFVGALLFFAAVPFGFVLGLVRARMVRSTALGSLVAGLAAPGQIRDALAAALRRPVARAGLLGARAQPLRDGRGPRHGAAGGRPAACRDAGRARRRAGRGDHPRPLAGRGSGAAAGRRRGGGPRARARAPGGRAARAPRAAARHRARGSSTPATPSAGGSSATCTTARSSGSSRSPDAAARTRRERERPRRLRPLLAGAPRSSQLALGELRELAEASTPPRWPSAASRGARRRSRGAAACPVEVDVADPRLPAAIEAARVLRRLGGARERRQARRRHARRACASSSAAGTLVRRGRRRRRRRRRPGARARGLRGLADRVEALDGRLRRREPARTRDTIRAEMPCAS